MNVQELMKEYEEAYTKKESDRVRSLYNRIKEILIVERAFSKLCDLGLDYLEYLNFSGFFEGVIEEGVEYTRLVYKYPEIKELPQYYNILGMLDYFVEDYDSAMRNNQKEYQIYELAGNRHKMIICQGNLAELLILKKDYHSALNHLLDVKITMSELGITNNLIGYYNRLRLAKVYLYLKEHDRVKQNLEEVMGWEYIDKASSMRYELYKLYAELCMQKGQYEQAMLYYHEAEELVEADGQGQELQNLLYSISQAYIKKGETNQALTYMDRYTNIIRSNSKSIHHLLRRNYELQKDQMRLEADQQKSRMTEVKDTNEQVYDSLIHCYHIAYIEEMIRESIREYKMNQKSFGLMFLSIGALKKHDEKCELVYWEKLFKGLSSYLSSRFKEGVLLTRMSSHKMMIFIKGDESHHEIVQKIISDMKEFESTNAMELDFWSGYVEYEKIGAKDLDAIYRIGEVALYQAVESKQKKVVIW